MSLPLLIVAGSGPSAEGFEHANVCTKKHSVSADYLCARHIYQRIDGMPFMCYKWLDVIPARDTTGVWKADHNHWDTYFRTFKPKHEDPSSGTCAVFSVIERWGPKTIGLIGFDFVLDKNKNWFHDAVAEYKAITGLVEVIDLRNHKNEYHPIRGL